ncbi:MAG: alpha/beta hydrolase [Bdellovibrionota bacterium]
MKLHAHIERGHSATAPLFVFVHGKAGHRDIMRIFSRSLPEGANQIFVEAPYPDKRGGFSWWDTDLKEFPTSQFEESLIALERVFASLQSDFGIQPEKVTALGFSQGAGILSHLLLSGRVSLNALVILAGFVQWPEELCAKSSATSILWAHGESDDVVTITRARSDVKRLQEIGYEVALVSDPVGHKVGTAGMRALKSFCLTLED